MACKQVVRWCTVAGACAWLATVGAASSYGATITIDSFDLPGPGTVFILPKIHTHKWDYSYDAGNDSILGGEREVSIAVSDTLDSNSIVAVGVIGVDLNVDDGNGLFTFGSQTGRGHANSGSGIRLVYDGLGQNGLGSFDLTDGGVNTDFALRFTGSDGVVPGGLDVNITAESSLGGKLTYSGNIPNHSDPSVALIHLIPFAEFESTGADASFGAVDKLIFDFNTDRTPNVDFSLDYVVTVPEPTSVALLGLCLAILVGCVLGRRR